MTYLGPKERQALRVLLGLDPAGTAEKQAAQKALLPLLTPPEPRQSTSPLRTTLKMQSKIAAMTPDQAKEALGEAAALLGSCAPTTWSSQASPSTRQEAWAWQDTAVEFLKKWEMW